MLTKQFTFDKNTSAKVDQIATNESPEILMPSQVWKLLITQSGQIEKLFGSPQDIEWAFDGSTLWFLQARPITSKKVEGPRYYFLLFPPHVSETSSRIITLEKAWDMLLLL